MGQLSWEHTRKPELIFEDNKQITQVVRYFKFLRKSDGSY